MGARLGVLRARLGDYNSLVLGIAETSDPGRSANLEFRVFDDGVGFRVVLDESFASNSEMTVVTSENTGFDFAGDHTAWWIRNEVTNPRFEQEYEETSLSEIPGGTRETRPTDTPIRNGAHTPLTVDAEDVYRPRGDPRGLRVGDACTPLGGRGN